MFNTSSNVKHTMRLSINDSTILTKVTETLARRSFPPSCLDLAPLHDAHQPGDKRHLSGRLAVSSVWPNIYTEGPTAPTDAGGGERAQGFVDAFWIGNFPWCFVIKYPASSRFSYFKKEQILKLVPLL